MPDMFKQQIASSKKQKREKKSLIKTKIQNTLIVNMCLYTKTRQ